MAAVKLRQYQEDARQAIWDKWHGGDRATLLVLPTGCHAAGEEILKADGSLVKAEDIKPGDRLCGSDGTPRIVLETHSGIDQLYKIIPTKGNPFIVSGKHPLTLVRTNLKKNPKYPCEENDNSYIDVSVDEWLTWSKNKKHIHKLVRCKEVVSFDGEELVLPLDPYFLGILLGDGGLTTTINVTTQDKEVVTELEKIANSYDMHLREVPAGYANTYHFVGNGKSAIGSKGSRLHQLLKDAGLRGMSSEFKHVPAEYKTSSIDNRLEIIAGLIDSDGSLSCNGYDYISKSPQLADDLTFMCRSIGLAAYVKSCKKRCQTGYEGTYYRVSISGDCSRIPCRVEHKKATVRKQKKNVLRTGFQVESIGKGKYYGFTVDKDHRYLLDDFTITHNTGKTVTFAAVAKDDVEQGGRVLILAHRGELLDQAADKLTATTGLIAATEKAEQTSIGTWFSVVVGSVQTLMRDSRLKKFAPDHFSTIIVDEAHHAVSDSYRAVLDYFEDARVLGVTATADRGDRRSLGEVFDSIAYEYSMPQAIKDGYLCPIKAQTIPLTLDLSGVGVQAGDFKLSDIDTALDPYLHQIADEMIAAGCMERKTVVFLPLIRTSQKFTDILRDKGFAAAEVNGESADRAEVLADFDEGRYNVLCNSMLLTEGWDCPTVDCIIVLRPTKVRSLYCQMVGRGTRISPGKDHLLLLDFLWHTELHELCHPAHLIADSDDVARKMTENIEAAGMPIDIEEAVAQATEDVVAQREEALAAQLEEMRKRKRKLVDPLQFEMSIAAEDLVNYAPSFGFELAPPSTAQKDALEKAGILPDEIDNAGKASLLLDRLSKRRDAGLATPRQIRQLEGRGFRHVGQWEFEAASKLISRIAANGWRTPKGINPATYTPEKGAMGYEKPSTQPIFSLGA